MNLGDSPVFPDQGCQCKCGNFSPSALNQDADSSELRRGGVMSTLSGAYVRERDAVHEASMLIWSTGLERDWALDLGAQTVVEVGEG